MATYYDIFGQKVQYLSSDPANLTEGQVWYNSTSNTAKLQSVTTAGVWATGGNVGTARTTLTGAGSQTANVIFAGQLNNPPFADQSLVEEYNGTSWTEVNNYPIAVGNLSGLGTQTAALGFGGYPNVSVSNEYDGTNWTSTGSLNTARELLSSNIGIQTAGLAAAGFIRPSSPTTATEEYNGSTWTTVTGCNTSLYGRCGSGTQTAGLISGGQNGGTNNATEEYNGSTWTTGNNRPYSAGTAMGSGTQTAALHYGGNPASPLTTTASYDGTNWTTETSMSVAKAMGGGCGAGTSGAALASGGSASGATEEFTGAGAAETRTITTS